MNIRIKDKFSFALSVVLFLVFPYLAKGQVDNFEFLADASGFDRSSYEAELEAATQELIFVLPAEYQTQFKVFDFGFYLHNETQEGGFEEAFEKGKALAASKSPYYLLFGKQSDQNGIYTKFWFDLKLPNAGNFSCITNDERKIVFDNVEFLLKSTYELSNKSPFTYSNAEIASINRLRLLVEEIVTCCDVNLRTSCSLCIPNDNLVEEYLMSKQFEKIDISFEIKGILSLKDKINNKQNKNIGDYVTDYANLEIEVENELVDIEFSIENNIETFISPEDNPKIFIINNSNLCDGSYETILTELNDNLPHLGAIIYLRDNSTGIDEMYIKSFGILKEDLLGLGSYSIGELEESASGGVNTFEQLIEYVRMAEDSLIFHGYSDIEDRIHMIRGIYYGTTWSFDYGQMSSDGRNVGFNAYTYSPVPNDPRPFLGQELFDKLYNSPEVIDGDKGIDWGHIIIGLDARRKYVSRNAPFPGHLCTGLEACTWVGDLGGGAGKLAWDRATNPNIRAKSKFTTSHFGGWVNLEGDVAGYLIGKENNTSYSAPDMALKNEDYIADALQAYLLNDTNNDWTNRASIFLNMLGGTTITEETIQAVADKIEDFGENYLLIRAYDGADIDMIEASAHLKGAAKEIAQIFIDALQNAGSKIRGTLDPNPSPKGEPYMKYKVGKKVNELKDKIRDWLKN